MSRKNKQFMESLRLNNRTYLQYYNRLTEIAISSFEWLNMPDTIDTRFLELTFFEKGSVVFFFYDVMEKFLCLPVLYSGRLNVYNIPKNRVAYATNGYRNNLTNKNSVIGWNNQLRTNSLLDVQMFATRLYNMDRIIDINVNAQKSPQLIECEENQRLTMENAYKDYDGNIPVIYVDKGFSDKNKLKTFSSNTPFVSPQIYELKQKYWSEALSYLGIASPNLKKERMVMEEAMQTIGDVIANRKTRLKPRQEFCKQVNEMFGLNIAVRFDDNIFDEEKISERFDGGANG